MRGQQPRAKPDRPLTKRTIVLWVVLVGLVGTAIVAALLYFYGGGTDQDRAGLDVVRTAGPLVVGIGGFIALLLAALRQRSTELTLEHQREVAAANERDVAEQHFTDLYTRAVDQLGSGQAPVRLGGLHALERLAQINLAQRPTIVDVICAYLRMPYTPPDDQPPAEDAPRKAHTRYEQRRQELQVRLTAQRILAAHLRPKAGETFWTGIDLDLTGAHLHQLDLTNCHIQKAQFDRAQFDGDDAGFDEVQFGGDASFGGARFGGGAVFSGARFDGYAAFGGAQFEGPADFGGEAQFEEYADFGEAQFDGPVDFREAQFERLADFGEARFGGDAVFSGVRFGGDAVFSGVRFGGYAVFGEDAVFSAARARPSLRHSWPAGWTTREARTVEGETEGWMYLVRVDLIE